MIIAGCIFTVIYYTIAVITLILFRKGNLTLEFKSKWGNETYHKANLLIQIIYSIGWPVPFTLLLIAIIKKNRK